MFRFPKELLLRSEAVLLLSVAAINLVWQPHFRLLLLDRVASLSFGACAVSALLSTLFSSNRGVSIGSLAYVLCCLIVFWGTYIGAVDQTLPRTVLICVGAGIINALLAIAQRLDWWNPFVFDAEIPHRMRTTALIGNPNDVGASLAICFVAVATLAVLKKKVLFVVMALVLAAGVLASDALTAMIATVAAAATMTLLASRRRAIMNLAVVALIALAGAFLLPPVRTRLAAMSTAIKARDYDNFTAHRIVGYLVAWKIFKDNPVVGAGPGTFKWLYLPYRVRVEAEYPRYYLKMTENLGEVHNDHLQILAEEGVIGYAAFLIAVVALGSRTWTLRNRDSQGEERLGFVRLGALPLAVCFWILAATGFPLELTAVMTPLIFLAACMFRWGHDALA